MSAKKDHECVLCGDVFVAYRAKFCPRCRVEVNRQNARENAARARKELARRTEKRRRRASDPIVCSSCPDLGPQDPSNFRYYPETRTRSTTCLECSTTRAQERAIQRRVAKNQDRQRIAWLKRCAPLMARAADVLDRALPEHSLIGDLRATATILSLMTKSTTDHHGAAQRPSSSGVQEEPARVDQARA